MTADTEVRALLARLATLEARDAIRQLMARYLELCDHLDGDTPMSELGALFTRDAVWMGKGPRYAAGFGRFCGRDAILGMMSSYCRPTPHFAINAHFLCSEAIRVEGLVAIGRWMMLQTSTYTGGRSDLRAARIEVSFAVEGDRWRIARFETENVFRRPVDRWDDPEPVLVPDKRGG